MAVLTSIIISCCFLVLLIMRFVAGEESLFALWCSFLMSLDVFIFVAIFSYWSLFITVMRPALANYLTAFVFALPFFYVLILIARDLKIGWSDIKQRKDNL